MKIFVDIETIPDQTPGSLEAIKASIKPPANYSKPDSIAKWLEDNAAAEADKQWRKTALSGTSGEIIVIGFAFDESDSVDSMHRFPGESEADLLRQFWNVIDQGVADRNGHWSGVEWIGHNVAFDLRFLKQRGLVNGIQSPVKLNPDARHGAGHVFCTMQEWAGYRDTVSLDALCKALGIASPKDEGINGAQVFDLWRFGKAALIVEYCRRDVEAVQALYRRMNPPRMLFDLEAAA